MDASLDGGMSHTVLRVTLNIDIVCKVIVSRTYFLYYLKQESQIWYVDASWDGGVYHLRVTVTLNLTFDLVLE